MKTFKCKCKNCGYRWTINSNFKPKYCSDICNAMDNGGYR